MFIRSFHACLALFISFWLYSPHLFQGSSSVPDYIFRIYFRDRPVFMVIFSVFVSVVVECFCSLPKYLVVPAAEFICSKWILQMRLIKRQWETRLFVFFDDVANDLLNASDRSITSAPAVLWISNMRVDILATTTTNKQIKETAVAETKAGMIACVWS